MMSLADKYVKHPGYADAIDEELQGRNEDLPAGKVSISPTWTTTTAGSSTDLFRDDS